MTVMNCSSTACHGSLASCILLANNPAVGLVPRVQSNQFSNTTCVAPPGQSWNQICFIKSLVREQKPQWFQQGQFHLNTFFYHELFLFSFFFYFQYKFIYFKWRLITLQYCIGFAIHLHESATGVLVFPILNPLPPPSPYRPSGSSQCTSPKHPVSRIEPGLAICFTYDNIHVSMPFSLIIPPSSSPTESKRLFYTSVSLLLSHIQGYHYQHSKFHIYALVYCIGVFLSGLLHSV